MRAESKRKSIWYYIKNYKFKSILLQNFLFISAFVMLPLIATIYRNYMSFDGEMSLRMEESNKELLEKSATVVDNIVSNVFTIIEDLTGLPECRVFCEPRDLDPEYADNIGILQEKIGDYLVHYPYVESICLYSESNGLVLKESGTVSIDDITGTRNKWYDIYRIFPMEQAYSLVGEKEEIMFCAPLYTKQQTSMGLLVIYLNMETIGSWLEREASSDERTFLILDISGQIRYCNNEELTEADKQYYQRLAVNSRNAESGGKRGRSEKVVSVCGSNHQSWKYALVSDRVQYTEEIGKLRNLLLGSVLTGLLPSILAAYLITVVTYRPVKKIMNVMEKPEEYLYNEQEASNEVLYITSNILNTIDKKEKMQDELVKRMQSLRVAQSLALQFQVDPHFLFNTLEMIKWTTVEDIGPGNRAGKQLSKVARLYRIALESDNMILPLREELEFLRLYIEILEIRYEGSIRFEWEIDEALCDCMVVKLCLQPLVENAVKHGLKTRNYMGTVLIRTRRWEGRLQICIENDGKEMSPSDIDAMNLAFSRKNGFQDARVGLLNINERIQLLYGPDYGLRIDRRDAGLQGMRVTLTFPLT